MPLTATYTEEMVRGIAPDEATFNKAQEVAKAKHFQNLGISADGTWLLGECQGSGHEPYQLSADFHDPQNPVLTSWPVQAAVTRMVVAGNVLHTTNREGGYAAYLNGKRIAVSRDMRLSSPAVANALSMVLDRKALMSSITACWRPT
jgi:hypothetical protein